MGFPQLWTWITSTFRCTAPAPASTTDYLYIDVNSYIYAAITTCTSRAHVPLGALGGSNSPHDMRKLIATENQRMAAEAAGRGREFHEQQQQEKEANAGEASLISRDVVITEREIVQQFLNDLEAACIALPPKRVLYLAVDGVAPAAKQKTQRQRRFQRRGVSSSHSSVDTNMVTPGTSFMRRLTDALEVFSAGYAKAHPEVSIVLDGPNVPGEGETKMCRFMRSQRPQVEGGGATCVLTRDADMVLYCLSTMCEDIFIVRDVGAVGPSQFTGANSSNIISVRQLRRGMLAHTLPLLDKATQVAGGAVEVSASNVLLDLVGLLSILQNDYLPTLEGLDTTRSSTLDDVLQMYIDTFQGHWVDAATRTLVIPRLMPLFEYCAKKARRSLAAPASSNEQPDEREIFASFTLTKQGARTFAASTAAVRTTPMPEESVREYLQGLAWVSTLVLQFDVAEWNWVYGFDASPLPSQLVSSTQNDASLYTLENLFPNGAGEPTRPFESLLVLLPRWSVALLPDTYRTRVADCEEWQSQSEVPVWGDFTQIRRLAAEWEPRLTSLERRWNQHSEAMLFMSRSCPTTRDAVALCEAELSKIGAAVDPLAALDKSSNAKGGVVINFGTSAISAMSSVPIFVPGSTTTGLPGLDDSSDEEESEEDEMGGGEQPQQSATTTEPSKVDKPSWVTVGRDLSVLAFKSFDVSPCSDTATAASSIQSAPLLRCFVRASGGSQNDDSAAVGLDERLRADMQDFANSAKRGDDHENGENNKRLRVDVLKEHVGVPLPPRPSAAVKKQCLDVLSGALGGPKRGAN